MYKYMYYWITPPPSLLTSYKELCLQHSETLKLWPAYVYWARGQLRLAATSFSTAIDSLKHSKEEGGEGGLGGGQVGRLDAWTSECG